MLSAVTTSSACLRRQVVYFGMWLYVVCLCMPDVLVCGMFACEFTTRHVLVCGMFGCEFTTKHPTDKYIIHAHT
jgi:hypothetical protein